jgi:hypothetical protein
MSQHRITGWFPAQHQRRAGPLDRVEQAGEEFELGFPAE